MIIRSTQQYYNNDILIHIIVCTIDASILFQGNSLVLITCMLISILTGVSIMTAVSILIMVYPNSGTDSGVHLVWHCRPFTFLLWAEEEGKGLVTIAPMTCSAPE